MIVAIAIVGITVFAVASATLARSTDSLDNPVYPENATPEDRLIARDVNHPLVQLISAHESGGDYNVVFGGRRFTDMSAHPFDVGGELRERGIGPARITSGRFAGQVSTAAGRWQFLLGTWKEHQRALDLPDFSRRSQDLAMLREIPIESWRAFDRGDFETAIRLASTKFASLPGNNYGQERLSMNEALEELQGYI